MKRYSTRQRRTFNFDIKIVLITLAILFLVVFEVLPMINLLINSLFYESSFSLQNYREVYSNVVNWNALVNTLKISLYSMLLSVIIAFPLAWFVGRTNLPGKNFFRTVFVTTYMIPPYVGAIAWSQLLNPRVGYLNVALMRLFNLADAPFDIYGIGGIVWVSTLFYYPYAFITISRALENMDPTLEEAARICGSSPLKTITSITIPLMYPSILAGGILVFTSVSSAFGIPSIIGMPANIEVLTTRIISYVYLGTSKGMQSGAALAVSLMVVVNLLLYLSNVVLGRKEYITISGKSTRPVLIDLGRWKWFWFVIVTLFSIIAVVLPIGSVFITSFIKSLSKPLRADNLSFARWAKVLTNARYLEAFKVSVILAVVTALIGTVLALLLSYLLIKTDVRGKAIPDFLIMLGSSTPSIVIALALIMAFSGKFGLNLYSTMSILIVAYLIKYLMMPMRTVSASLTQIHSSLEEAALNSGASWLRVFKDILLPLIFPSVVAGWFLIFMPSFYELSMSTLLYGSNTKTIGVLLHELQTYADPQDASVLSSLILIVVLVGDFITRKVSKGNIGI